MRHLLAGLFLPLILWAAGCSSSSDDFVGGSGAPVPNRNNRPLVGRLFLGFPAGDAEVVVVNPEGNGEIARGDLTGGVFIIRTVLPASFRILVRPKGSPVEFTAEVRDYNPERWCQVNVLTSLASLYLRQNPGVTLAQAEAEVRRLLNLPGYYDLANSPDESPRDPFSHLAFLQQAARSGGWTSFSQAALRQAPTTYALTSAVLSQPFSGLEPGLNSLAESNRVAVSRLTVFAGVGPSGATRFKGEAVASEGSLVGEFVFGMATGIAGNLATGGAKAGVGWAASMMGLSFGTSGQLQEISSQLSGIQQTLDALVAALANAQQQSLVNTLNSSGPDQIGSTFSLVNSTVSGALSNGSFQPTAGPINVSYSFNTIGQIQLYDWFGMVTNITNSLLGTNGSSNLITVSQNSAMALYGLDTPSSLQGFPVRTGALVDYSLTTYSKYAGFQQQGLYLDAERQHFFGTNGAGSAFPPAGASYRDPVLGISQLVSDFTTGLQWVRQERAQIPLPLPRGDIMVDLEYGLMWYLGLQPQQKYDDAVTIAEGAYYPSTTPLPDGTSIGYENWRLPTYNEMLVLQARGVYNPQAPSVTNGTNPPPVNSNNAWPDYGQATSGLQGLGFFNMSNILSGDGDVWFQAWNISGSAAPDDEGGYEFRLNHQSENNDQKSGGTTRPFLMVRTLGARPVVNPLIYASSSSTPESYPSVTLGPSPTNGELACYGTFQSISGATAQPLASPRPSPIPSPLSVPLLQASANLNFQLAISGGTLGQNSNTVSFGVNPITYTSGSVSTLGPDGLPNLLGQLVWFGTSAVNVVSNYFANIPGMDGLLVPISTASTTLTVGYGPSGSAVTSSTVTSNATTANQTSVQLQPRNVQYGTGGSLPVSGASANYPLYLTAFFNNGSVASVGGRATWNVTAQNPAQSLQGIEINTSTGTAILQLNVPSQAAPKAFNVTVQATYQGQSDNTTMQILPGLSN